MYDLSVFLHKKHVPVSACFSSAAELPVFSEKQDRPAEKRTASAVPSPCFSTYTTCPLTGLAPAAQSSPLSLRARTSFLLNCQGQPRKKNRFRGSFTLLFNIHNLPLTGLAPAAQSSARAAFATAYLTEHHFSSIVRGSHEKRTAFCGSFTLLFNIHNLPPDRACACGAKLSAFAPSTNVISPQLLRAAEPELFTSSNVRVCASRVPLKLSTILSS